MRRSKLWSAAALAVAMVAMLIPGAASGLGAIEGDTAPGLGDFDARTSAAPTAERVSAVRSLGARASWNRFGTPRSLIRDGGYLASDIAAPDPVAAARSFVDDNRTIFGVSSADLDLVQRTPLVDSNGYAVLFQQRFGGLRAVEGGQLTVGVVGSPSRGWDVAFASSSLAPGAQLSGEPTLSPQEAWAIAARDVGYDADASELELKDPSNGWTVMATPEISDLQRARLVVVPTPFAGARVAYEVLFVNESRLDLGGYHTFVDARTGEILVRKNIVEHSHPPGDTFSGTMPPEDSACDEPKPPSGWTVAPGESVETVMASVAEAEGNDAILHLLRDGVRVARSADIETNPEVVQYSPPDSGEGVYQVQVCDYSNGEGWSGDRTYDGTVTFSTTPTDDQYAPRWKIFPAYPPLGQQSKPWVMPDDDTRETWCWEPGVGCDRVISSAASRSPWDFDVQAGVPTFTTTGNNAVTAESWTSPLTPSPPGFRPSSPERDYSYEWNNTWFNEKCDPASLVLTQEPDLSAAVTNLFVGHNRMHDWAYALGFTERTWNAQEYNFGHGGTQDGDPVLGNAQAAALDGGPPLYLGRNNASMLTLPDGVPPSTNMYLWIPTQHSFFVPCVDGDFDMAVIGHEYGHMIENRMIGKGGTRSGYHAGGMGESNGDMMGMEYLNGNGFVPVADENPYAVGVYPLGNHQRGIRNYGMNFPRTGGFPAPGVTPRVDPLNFSNIGYDLPDRSVHAEGEIWSTTNFGIRSLLNAKYDAQYPSTDIELQSRCANGLVSAEHCPGSRRWVQIMFDAYLLMPNDPSMLDARDAYLAADLMRFGGANQSEIWQGFAERGFGPGAYSTNTSSEEPGDPPANPDDPPAYNPDTDPTPDFTSPLHPSATVTFEAVASDEGNAPVPARIFVGHYEARVSPIADTDPATALHPSFEPNQGTNLDNVAAFIPGTYEFIAQAKGYGAVRFSVNLEAGQNRTVTVNFRTNWASSEKGAAASGDGEEDTLPNLIDDTEATQWERIEATSPNVNGSQVTVDLAGDTPRTIRTVQVSAHLFSTTDEPQSRFTALRQFEVQACTASTANANCTGPDSFSSVYTSPDNAFPGLNPRPVAPELILRQFQLNSAVTATHLRIVVLSNQCTGNPEFQGPEQEDDPATPSDCTESGPGEFTTDRDDEVRIAEFQAFSSPSAVTAPAGTGAGPGPGPDPIAELPKECHRLASLSGANIMIGTMDGDVLEGTSGRDGICGRAGRDHIRGLDGNDILIGGRGRDRLRGQGGNDALYAGAGNDVAAGGGGNDRVVGFRGNDLLVGQGGRDFLKGMQGSDSCRDGAGRDRLQNCEAKNG